MSTRVAAGGDRNVLEFLRLVWELNHHLQSTSKRMRDVLGVTGPQRLALRMIEREPGMATLRLSELLHLHPSTVTGVLDRLEREGLVEREDNPEDGRSTRLHLTRRGRLLLARGAEGTIEAAVGAALSALAVRRIDTAREVLTAVCSALERSSERRAPKVVAARRSPRRARRKAR
jgi:DNA-binding MarR family transcriptional regulator